MAMWRMSRFCASVKEGSFESCLNGNISTKEKTRLSFHTRKKNKPVGDFENISVLTNLLQVWIVYFVTNLNKSDFMGKIWVDCHFLKSRHLEVKVPIVVAVELFYTCRSKMLLLNYLKKGFAYGFQDLRHFW